MTSRAPTALRGSSKRLRKPLAAHGTASGPNALRHTFWAGSYSVHELVRRMSRDGLGPMKQQPYKFISVEEKMTS